ncbi:coiled-coiled tumor supressor protein [Tritrichomonas foetus]|uniref:Coiled-coiled tumor supressor protein n=1 Tax=Tritrichomonas foetus TaxID=1144522 RepID=A0A1J4JY39_9EUKA|nr:coiled-coiled tumor supressor protein [Tritrichomonas foetus]|eukprot:OHT03907.1 coiled-coiled tumor supressor protein [Tritrichomonas foetus]
MKIFIDKIATQWASQQNKVSKEWEEKEASIMEGFTRIGTVICEYKNAVAEKQTLEKQLKSVELEHDHLKKVPSDSARQERLVRINSLRLEIQKLEEDLTKADAELRAANEGKNRYKRLLLQANKTVHEMEEAEAKRKQNQKRRVRQ